MAAGQQGADLWRGDPARQHHVGAAGGQALQTRQVIAVAADHEAHGRRFGGQPASRLEHRFQAVTATVKRADEHHRDRAVGDDAVLVPERLRGRVRASFRRRIGERERGVGRTPITPGHRQTPVEELLGDGIQARRVAQCAAGEEAPRREREARDRFEATGGTGEDVGPHVAQVDDHGHAMATTVPTGYKGRFDRGIRADNRIRTRRPFRGRREAGAPHRVIEHAPRRDRTSVAGAAQHDDATATAEAPLFVLLGALAPVGMVERRHPPGDVVAACVQGRGDKPGAKQAAAIAIFGQHFARLDNPELHRVACCLGGCSRRPGPRR